MNIHKRIQLIRAQRFGHRGRARFARSLGISPSTYNYYERDRVPPPAVLLKMSEVTGADLNWILTGETAAGEHSLAPITKRFQLLLDTQPDLAPLVSSFLSALEKAHPPAPPAPPARQPPADPVTARTEMVPVLGRTAAGIPQFWSETELTDALTELRPDRWISTQRCHLSSGPADEALPQTTVLIQTHKPTVWAGISVAEFLHVPALSRPRVNTFALRVDGDSMVPALEHGDLVLLSPTERACSGQPAVVQLRDQIGLTCKLYRPQDDQVHLIPINESYRITSHPQSEVVWALNVLARVKLA